MDETTETTGRCPAQYCRLGTLEQCHLPARHSGAHRSESYDWPNAPYCAADAGEGACLRKPGHKGEHAWRTVTAEALDRGDAWAPGVLRDPLEGKGVDDFRPHVCVTHEMQTFAGPMDELEQHVMAGLGEVERRLTTLEGRFSRLAKSVEQIRSAAPAPGDLSGPCAASLRFSGGGPYRCVLDAGHGGQHEDSDGDAWAITYG